MKWNSDGQDTCGKKCIVLFVSKIVFLVVLSRWKRNKFHISMKFDFKKRKSYFESLFFSFIWWATLLTNSLYEPHGTYVSGFTFFIEPRRYKKSTINFFTFITGLELTSWCLLRPWYIPGNKRPVNWSGNLWANERAQNKSHWEGVERGAMKIGQKGKYIIT